MKKKVFSSILVTASILLTCYVTAGAEGSKSFTQNGGDRAYTEWDVGNYTAQIERATKLSVYAKDGETLYLGSSISKAYDGKDIVLRTPSGQEIVLDVISSGTGYIDTYVKEQAGPNVAGATPDGYTPLEYKVKQTGIYSLEFHPASSVKNDKLESTPVEKIALEGKQGRAVAAWDISVYDVNGVEKSGRVFTSYLALNMGGNDLIFKGNVNVLTKDGYIYDIKMNGIDPYGFIMYSNNRGLVDATSQMSLYKNGYSTTNEMTKMLGNVIAPRPDLQDTDKSYTHYIFFNRPSDDLPDSMPTSPEAIAKINGFKFEGSNNNITTVASGGYFNVEFSKKTTYQLIIDTNQDGVFDDRDVILADAAAKGVNKVYWNGCDAQGDAIPAGNYKVKLFTKGGEYHFPMLDVETSPGGLSIQLVNDSRVSEEDSYKVYYDNTSYKTADGTSVNTNSASKIAINPANALGGISSKNGCYIFNEKYGDQRALDIWTYTLGEEANTELTVVEGITTGTLSGDIFFDSDKNAEFGANEAGIAGINVAITCEDGTVINTTTDSAGKYTATIPLGKYTVAITDPDGHILTTAGDLFTGTLTKEAPNAYLSSTGYYYIKDVAVAVDTSADEITVGENLDYNVVISNTTQFNVNGVEASVIIPADTTYLSDTSSGKYDYQSGKVLISELAPGESFTFKIKVKANKEGIYTVNANATCNADADSSNNQASASYKANGVEIAKPVYSAPYSLDNKFAYIFGYNDAEMAPENDMKVGESCAVLYRLLKQNNLLGSYKYDETNEPVYDEFKGRWDRSAAEYMIYKNIFAKDMSVFGLDGSITRKQAFKMFAVALGFTNNTTMSFEDYAAILQDAGYLEGDGSGDLKLNDFITRAEFCKVYNLITKRNQLSLTDASGKTITAETYGFTDLAPKSWYYSIMLKATSAFDDDGHVDVAKRGVRNVLDDFE